MCDPAVLRPDWRALYAAVAIPAAAGLVTEISVPAGVWRTAARCLLATAAFVAMGLWVRRHAAALEQADWCACAPSTVTMRVIPCPRVASAEAEARPELEPAGVQ